MSVSMVVRRKLAFLIAKISPSRERCAEFRLRPACEAWQPAPDGRRFRAEELPETARARAWPKVRHQCYRRDTAPRSAKYRSAAVANLRDRVFLFSHRPS